MESSEEAKNILKPIFDEYNRILDSGDCEKAADYYDPDSVLILTGKKCIYGRKAIMNELLKFDKMMGKTTTKLFNEQYQMYGDYITVRAEYETFAEHIGTFKGKFTQIWRKSNNTYLIIHDLFEML